MIAAPPPAALLTVWEQAASQPHVHRTLGMLRAADPEASDTDLARLTVGEADRRLLALRDAAFGSHFDAICRCPQCHESIQLDFGSDDFPAREEALDGAPRRMNAGAVSIEFRAPTLVDLAEAARSSDVHTARSMLLDRCITSARSPAGEAIAQAMLEPTVVAAVGAALEHADPFACTRLQLHCPLCAHEWSSVFDVSAYLWAELDTWAKGILREVHVLARAYGWSEEEILALSPQRRREYLEMAVA